LATITIIRKIFTQRRGGAKTQGRGKRRILPRSFTGVRGVSRREELREKNEERGEKRGQRRGEERGEEFYHGVSRREEGRIFTTEGTVVLPNGTSMSVIRFFVCFFCRKIYFRYLPLVYHRMIGRSLKTKQL